MRVSLVAFDRFTDVDLFLAWDLLSRVPEIEVRIAAVSPRIRSSTGIEIAAHDDLGAIGAVDGVYVSSGMGSRAFVQDARAMAALRAIDPARQVVAAVDSGVLVLAALGLLDGKRATTYPAADLHEAIAGHGACLVDEALVVEGNVATAAQCLAGVDLVAWFVSRLVGVEAAAAAVDSVRRLGTPRRDGIAIERVALPHPDATALIAQLDAELTTRYPEEGANHFGLDREEVSPGRGAFLIARVDGAPVACGAVRLLDAGAAELKRMYTAPGHRGHGVGRVLLSALEKTAADLGARRLVLETGARQPEAIGLYTRAGFVAIPSFGGYVESPLSVCLGKAVC
jgi:GNAT superfamily N-acetyltransferase/putative intracellular protease/amidase